ncbi:MAG: MmcQ/YjbR family DNA-binding protein [Actinomycetota bacterium]|nr:MmcQ/YjbR family DNA-binding protein [Actinomycetota bacterium]MDA8073598.1 MmcQ/YjbR family DNA-binding protein [Actinomycetota bacterium]
MSVADRLRAVVLALPGVDERETWGKPTFRVTGRLFLTLGADDSTATMKAAIGDQVALIAAEPAVFSPAAYLGRHGWVTVALERCDPDEIEAMVLDSYRRRAPRQLAARSANQDCPQPRSTQPEPAGTQDASSEHHR